MAVFRVQHVFCADIGKAVPVLSAFVQCQRVFLTGYRVRDFYGFPCIFGFGGERAGCRRRFRGLCRGDMLPHSLFCEYLHFLRSIRNCSKVPGSNRNLFRAKFQCHPVR